MSLVRFGALALVLAAGIAGGIGLNAALTGTTADDPCHGFGTQDRTITGPAEEGSKEFTVCKKPGYEVVFDPDGTPVVQSLREEEAIEYYKTHPAENPVLIADQTYEADFAQNGFVKFDAPSVADAVFPGECQEVETIVGASACLPPGWKVLVDSPEIARFGDEISAYLAIYPASAVGTAGTKCSAPATVELAAGKLAVCAFPVDPFGWQGHGLRFSNEREAGLTLMTPKDEAARIQGGIRRGLLCKVRQ